jgi:hypothetical protein
MADKGMKMVKWMEGPKKMVTKTYKAGKMLPVDGKGCQKGGKRDKKAY